MQGSVLSLKNIVENYSDLDIQKYNGKSVPIASLFGPVLCESNVLAIFKVSPIRASDDVRLRSLLKGKGIRVNRFKSKQLNLLKRIFYKIPSINLIDNVFGKANFEAFFRFMDSSAIILEFDDMDHFLFFKTFLMVKLERLRLSFFSVKINDQYFLTSSQFFKNAVILAGKGEYSLSKIKSFNFFYLLTIRNFLYFCISLKYQMVFLGL